MEISKFGHFFLFIFSILSTIGVYTGKTSSEISDLPFLGKSDCDVVCYNFR